MSRPFVPQAIVDLAHARREARARRDWADADRLRAEIEAAGWAIVDRGVDFDLRPARPADVVVGGAVRYGSSGSVPSRLDEPPAGRASVVLVLGDDEAAERFGASPPPRVADLPVVIVAAGLSPDADGALADLAAAGHDIVRLAAPAGPAFGRNAGCRRSVGSVIVLLEPVPGSGWNPGGTVTETLIAALADPSVAVAGTSGLVSTDLRQFDPSTEPQVDAVTGTGIAFRRTDYIERGPFDERFRDRRSLDIWFSLVLRDEGPEVAARRAVVVDVPAPDVHEAADEGSPDAGSADSERGRRRDRYRILDRFGRRSDLVGGGRAPDIRSRG